MRTIIRDNYDPQAGEYHETIVVDEAREKRWLFDCDGVYHDITKTQVVSERGDSEEYAASQKWVTEEVVALEGAIADEEQARKDADAALQDNIDAEAADREAADIELQGNIDAEADAREAADEDLEDAIEAEAGARSDADLEIWQEINTIEAASDVVDVVGTYADLQNYDTSTLHNNDLIKVLSDSTHNDAITYYRWNGTTFTYVGAEGPYYTTAETDALLAAKQDALTAGNGIDISVNNEISIDQTDLSNMLPHGAIEFDNVPGAGGTPVVWSENMGQTTTIALPVYDPFTGATASTAGTEGLVPAPATGDVDKYLKSDGTWGTVSAGATETVFYYNGIENFYKDAGLTELATAQDILEALESGTTYIKFKDNATAINDKYVQVISYRVGSDRLYIQGVACTNYNSKEGAYIRFEQYANSNRWNWVMTRIQNKLTAGTNISISGNTISASFTQTQADWNEVDNTQPDYILNKPSTTSAFTNNGSDGTSTYVEADDLATVATTGNYSDLNGAPAPYTLPIAGANTLGGIKVGSNLSIDANGVLSASASSTNNISQADWTALWQ